MLTCDNAIMTMNRRLVCLKPGRDLEFDEVPVNEPHDKGVIVKLAFAGVCHSDVDVWELGVNIPNFKGPWVGGHEPAGTIHSVGKDVTSQWKVGDRVIVIPWMGCQQCPCCKLDMTNLCIEEDSCDKFSIGFGKPGGYQQYVDVPDARFLARLPDSVPLDVAALVPCSALTAHSAVRSLLDHVTETIKLFGRSRVLVVGAGGLGLWAVSLIRALYPPETVLCVADLSEEKLQLARQAGAHKTVLWDKGSDSKTLVERTWEVCGGKIHGCIDFVNVQSTVSILQDVSEKGANWTMVGLLSQHIELRTDTVTINKLVIRGTFVDKFTYVEDIIRYLAEGKIKPPPIEHITLDRVQETLQLLKEGKVQGRRVVAH